jgi:hypothetical protein
MCACVRACVREYIIYVHIYARACVRACVLCVSVVCAYTENYGPMSTLRTVARLSESFCSSGAPRLSAANTASVSFGHQLPAVTARYEM